MNVFDIQVIPNPEAFGDDWYSRPTWLTPAYKKRAGGPVVAVSVKKATRDLGGTWGSYRPDTTYAVTTSDGRHWVYLTSGWRQVDTPAF